MFGYLTPEKGELKVREYELYRAHYCGVCLALKKHCTARSCLGLTYDAAFLSVLGASLGEFQLPQVRRCPFKPYKRINAAFGPCSEYAAAANAVMAYKKCLDDRADEHKLRGTLGAWLTASGAKKGGKRLGEAALKEIDGAMESLARLERERCDSIDEPALAFGRVMEQLLGGLPGPKSAAEPLRWMGLNLGRWLYLIDAWDDMEKDKASGSYNVFLLKFGSLEAARQEKERVEYNLVHSLYQARTALSLLPENPLTPIVDNVLGEGTVRRTYRALGKDPGCTQPPGHDIIKTTTEYDDDLEDI